MLVKKNSFKIINFAQFCGWHLRDLAHTGIEFELDDNKIREELKRRVTEYASLRGYRLGFCGFGYERLYKHPEYDSDHNWRQLSLEVEFGPKDAKKLKKRKYAIIYGESQSGIANFHDFYIDGSKVRLREPRESLEPKIEKTISTLMERLRNF